MIGYAIDVSHHQPPSAVPWDSLRGRVQAVMVRAANGVTLDERAREHVQRSRGIGAAVGLYSFFRSEQNYADQVVALLRQSEACGIGTGDICPALDIEDDPANGRTVSPSWSVPCEKFVERCEQEFGSALVYISQRGWSMLGKPEWVLHRPLWVAHYTTATAPASPAGMPAALWQHRVGPFDAFGPGGYFGSGTALQVDQNRILQPLPLVGYRPTSDEQERVRALVAETLRAGVQDADTDPSELAPETPRSV